MLNVDALKQLKQLKTDIKASRNLAEGVVKGSANKFGFVTLDSGKDVFLPADEMQKVLPGDRIEVEIKKEPKNKTLAIVERLIESPTKVFHGKYVVRGKGHFVAADIAGLSRWIFVPPQKRKGAKANDLVKCRLTQHPIKQAKPQAAVLEVLGNETTPGVEWDYAISKHALSETWSKPALEAVEKIHAAGIADKKAQRADYTDTPFVTIDAGSTQDMDDALWAQNQEDGWCLRVAIADPEALISDYPALEKEALARACTVYFPGRAIAMLPSELSSDLCSLKADQERLAKVLELSVSAAGEVTDCRIEAAVMQSRAKLSYREVSDYLAAENELEVSADVAESLRALQAATNAMRQWRQENALVNDARTDFYIELDDQQKIAAIHQKQTLSAHIIVEEAMLAANTAVAAFLAKAEASAIFVVHPGVREDRREALKKALTQVLPAEQAAQLDTLEGFRAAVRALQGSDEHVRVRHLLMKQLDKSVLAAQPAPHFGLGIAAYTTFTSPLRKANDYLLHKLVQALISEPEKAAHAQPDAALISAVAQGQQIARQAVNEVEQRLKCHYMRQFKGETFDAEIVRMFSAGFQVRLITNGIEGFVSTREMEGKYSFNQDLMEVTGPDCKLHLGQAVRVSVKQIDDARKQIQFALA